MYDKLYNFTGLPFRLTPDPKFLFHSRGHSKALAYLRYGLQQGEGFVVITGEVGAGKTTMVRALDSQLQMGNVVSAELVTTSLDPAELLSMVAAGFKLETKGLDKADLLVSFEKFFTARAAEGKRCLLVIDECHNLSASSLEELRMLANFQVGDKALLQTFLLGQGEFRDTLQAPSLEQFRQRVIAAHHLGPLSIDETREYINHRLRVVGWRDDPRFIDQAYELIHSYCGGIPRQINTLCDRILLMAALEEMHEVDEKLVKTVIEEMQSEIPKKDNASAPIQVTPASAAPVVADVPAEAPVPAPQPQMAPSPQVVAAPSLDMERRFQNLERKVEELEIRMRSNQDRMQKMLMMAMLSGDDLDIKEVLQTMSKVDKA